MELLQLKYFCHAAETESFSKTANFYLVPPSCISQSIKRLEEELKLPLFDRSANRIRLNDAGRSFYPKVKNALMQLEEGKRELQTTLLPPHLKICIRVNRRITMQAVEKFRKESPETDLIVRHHPEAEELFDLFIDDCPHTEEGYFADELFSEEIVLAVPADNPLALKKRLTAEDLRETPFITMNSGNSIHTITKEVCRKIGFEPRIAIQSDDPFYIRQCVELGLGLAIIPALSWRGQFSEKILFKPLLDSFRTTYVCHRNSPATQKFISILKREFTKEKEQSSE